MSKKKGPIIKTADDTDSDENFYLYGRKGLRTKKEIDEDDDGDDEEFRRKGSQEDVNNERSRGGAITYMKKSKEVDKKKKSKENDQKKKSKDDQKKKSKDDQKKKSKDDQKKKSKDDQKKKSKDDQTKKSKKKDEKKASKEQMPLIGKKNIRRRSTTYEEYDRRRSVDDEYDRRRSADDEYDRRRSADDEYDRRRSADDEYDRRLTADDEYDRRLTADDEYDRRLTTDDEYDRRLTTDDEYDRRLTTDDEYDRERSRTVDKYEDGKSRNDRDRQIEEKYEGYEDIKEEVSQGPKHERRVVINEELNESPKSDDGCACADKKKAKTDDELDGLEIEDETDPIFSSRAMQDDHDKNKYLLRYEYKPYAGNVDEEAGKKTKDTIGDDDSGNKVELYRGEFAEDDAEITGSYDSYDRKTVKLQRFEGDERGVEYDEISEDYDDKIFDELDMKKEKKIKITRRTRSLHWDTSKKDYDYFYTVRPCGDFLRDMEFFLKLVALIILMIIVLMPTYFESSYYTTGMNGKQKRTIRHVYYPCAVNAVIALVVLIILVIADIERRFVETYFLSMYLLFLIATATLIVYFIYTTSPRYRDIIPVFRKLRNRTLIQSSPEITTRKFRTAPRPVRPYPPGKPYPSRKAPILRKWLKRQIYEGKMNRTEQLSVRSKTKKNFKLLDALGSVKIGKIVSKVYRTDHNTIDFIKPQGANSDVIFLIPTLFFLAAFVMTIDVLFFITRY